MKKSQFSTNISLYLESDTQGDHSPDNVKFPDGSRHSSTALGMLSVTHIMPILVLLSKRTCAPLVAAVGLNSPSFFFAFNTGYSWLYVIHFISQRSTLLRL